MKKTTVYILLAVMLMTALCGCREETVNATSSPGPSATIAPETEDETNAPLESDSFDGNTNDQNMLLSPNPEDGFVHDRDGILDDNNSGNNSTKNKSGNNSANFGSNNSSH